MLRKLLGPVTAALGRRRRTVIVASLPVVLAGAILALAGASGGGAGGKAAVHGLVRATNGTELASSATSSTSFGPTVYTGIYQGVSPTVASLPVLPVNPGPLHARG